MIAKFYGTTRGQSDILQNEEELNEILEGAGRTPIIRLSDVRKGERTKKAPLPFTTQYLAAGGQQGTELLDTRRPCVLHSSFMKAWKSKAAERWVSSPICVPIRPAFPRKPQAVRQRLYHRALRRRVCGRQETTERKDGQEDSGCT